MVKMHVPSNIRRTLQTGILTLVLSLLVSLPVFADVGPKPSLIIHAENMPEQLCYMDLLVDASASGSYQNIGSSENYDRTMFDQLAHYHDDGWKPALVRGTKAPLSGDIKCNIKNGKAVMRYSYVGLPDQFKIIVVTADGQTVVSNVLNRQGFNSTVKFDYQKAKAYETSTMIGTMKQFVGTCSATLLIEGLILLGFGFSLKLNWKAFVRINIRTQFLLTLIVMLVMLTMGTWMALLAYMLFEIIILWIEAQFFKKHLVEHGTMRRVIFSITANAASFAFGFLVLMQSGL